MIHHRAMDSVLGDTAVYFTWLGVATAVLMAWKLTSTLWQAFRIYGLSRLLGPNVDLKKMGKWAGKTKKLISGQNWYLISKDNKKN